MERLYDYLCNLNPYTQQEALLLASIVKIAQVGGINRIQVKSDMIDNPDGVTPANVYAITFLDSGSGKDKPLRDIDKNIIESIKKDFYDRAIAYRDTKRNKIENEANEKFGEKKTIEKIRFINEHVARFLPIEISDATLEGFISTREAYEEAGFGSTFIKISEFGDYITSSNDHRAEFLSMVSEVFDYGDSNPKAIKGERDSRPVNDVPSSAIMHTSPSGLLEGRNRDKLFTFLNRGLARRSFVCYPPPLVIPTLPSSEVRTANLGKKSEARQMLPVLQASFLDMYTKTKKEFDTGDRSIDRVVNDTQPNVFVFTDEADEIIELYQIDNQVEANSIPEDSDESGLKSEKANRHWKVIKLAGLIAAFEHPEVKTVEVDDVNEAIRICTIYSKQVERFYKARPTDEVEKLYNYFRKHLDEWVSTMDIRSLNIVHKDKFSRWFEDVLSFVSEMLESNGYILETGKHGRSGLKYKVSRVVIKETHSKIIVFSQAESNEATETAFTPKEIPFEQFHTITGADRAWCATTFSQNYRKDENSTGKVSVISLDVDGGMKLADCVNILKNMGIQSLVTTTRNHGIQKGEKPAVDRYRVILPLCKELAMDNDTHKKRLSAVSHVFGIPNDVSTRNIGRLWFGNPHQKYEYIQGGCIDLEKFDSFDKPEMMSRNTNPVPSNTKNLEAWFAKNYELCGGRNNALYRASRFFYKDEGYAAEDTKEILLRINSNFDKPLEEAELAETIYKSF